MPSKQSSSCTSLLRMASYWAIIVGAISVVIAALTSGDLHKVSVLVFGVSISFASLATAITCVSLKTVPGAHSDYGRVEPTSWKEKPVQFVLCIGLFVSVAVLMLLMTFENYKMFFLN